MFGDVMPQQAGRQDLQMSPESEQKPFEFRVVDYVQAKHLPSSHCSLISWLLWSGLVII